MKQLHKPVPSFASEAEECAYWERTDSADHIDWSKAQKVRLPNLKPSTTATPLAETPDEQA